MFNLEKGRLRGLATNISRAGAQDEEQEYHLWAEIREMQILSANAFDSGKTEPLLVVEMAWTAAPGWECFLIHYPLHQIDS